MIRFVNNYLHTDDRHFEWYITNSWVLKHEPNDYNPAHSHANSLITGVYYLEVPEHSGDITFHKPDGLTNIFHVSTNLSSSNNIFDLLHHELVDLCGRGHFFENFFEIFFENLKIQKF